MPLTFGVAIVTYNGLGRTRQLLESLKHDRTWIDQLVISEDPCPYAEVHDGLVGLSIEHSCQLVTGKEWGCMQGNARQAMAAMETDVVALLSDDILVTPGCIADARLFWEQYSYFPVGIAIIPYWGNWTDVQTMGFIDHPLQFHTRWKTWIHRIPKNDFWEHDGFPRIYVNVHGSGFMVRRDVWNAVGGCSLETWCYDEDIAARIWLRTPTVCVVAPGRPFVHFGGMSQCGNEHPDTDFHTLDAWKRAWGGLDKPAVHALIRERMTERAYIDSYFNPARLG